MLLGSYSKFISDIQVSTGLCYVLTAFYLKNVAMLVFSLDSGEVLDLYILEIN